MRGEMVGEDDLEEEGKERMGEEQRTRDLGTKEAPQEEQGKELRREGGAGVLSRNVAPRSV